MKVLCVGDAYVTSEMMENGVRPLLAENDSLKVLFFGENSRTDMRDTVKAIEAMKRDQIDIPSELSKEITDADLLIVHLCPVTKKLIGDAIKLKAIMSCRGGTENIDIEAATEKGIIVATNPAHNANAVAEYTIGMIICETRNIARSNNALKQGIWREKFPNTATTIRELHDMTIGIIGFGSVGRLVVDKLSVFGCKILVYTPHPDSDAYDYLNYKFVSLNTLLKESDIVTIHARADKAIIGEREFSLMKPTSYLINTARSILVDQDALLNAIKEKQIMGAAIDVFETEPVIPDFYRQYDNLTITNHRGGDTINSYKDAPAFAFQNYLRFLSGEQVLFLKNKLQ